jgi:hypothetical protein
MDDQRERDEEREDDEAFLDVWREWLRAAPASRRRPRWLGCWQTDRLAAPAWRDAISIAKTAGGRPERHRERKANRTAPHVAFMSRGQIRTDCNSLILLSTDLHNVRHEKGHAASCEFQISLIFQSGGGGRTRTYEGLASGF